MKQISNDVYCSNFLFNLDIKTKILPSQYNDLPFLIIDNFFSNDICSEINKSILKKLENSSLNILDEEIRRTNIYSLDEKFKSIYEHNFRLFQRQIESFFNLALISSTEIQVLEYLKGSFYSMHSDDSSMLFDEEELVGFLPVCKERKLSTVLFTTDYDSDAEEENSFSGGELLFNFLFDKCGNNIEIKPKNGQLVVFPSNPFFTHEVKKVEKGRRISLVQWHNVILN